MGSLIKLEAGPTLPKLLESMYVNAVQNMNPYTLLYLPRLSS
jgi:hypothetical protein